jgi:2-methylcitrate dehydratase PrpD
MHTEMERPVLTRRRLLQGAGGLIAASALPANAAMFAASNLGQTSPASSAAAADLTGRFARYILTVREQSLPPKVLLDAKHHILDTIATMVSGSRLKPGEMAIRFIRTQGGVPEATVLATNVKTSAINAALVNGMFGHADETDGVEQITKTHPGCSIVPTALAMAERESRSGMEFIRAVTLGYDTCCRFVIALGADLVRISHRGVEGPGATMGSAATAASLARLDEAQVRYALSYAAQQVSGVWSWIQDNEHVEKAFDIGGMGARNGVTSAIMAQMGFTGAGDVLSGLHNVIEAFSSQPHPEELMAGLGSRYFISETAIKTFSVGYPIQAALDAFLTLRRENGLRVDNVERIVVKMPTDAVPIVNNSSMPNVNCQYNIAVALMEGSVSFENSHSSGHMADPQVRAIMQRVQLVADQKLMDPAAPRSGLVEVTLRDGRTVSHFTRFAPGTKENPLDTAGVNRKAQELMEPALGAKRTEAIIRRVNTLEEVSNMREFTRSLLSV